MLTTKAVFIINSICSSFYSSEFHRLSVSVNLLSRSFLCSLHPGYRRDILLGVILRWTSIPSSGSSNFLVAGLETGLSCGSWCHIMAGVRQFTFLPSFRDSAQTAFETEIVVHEFNPRLSFYNTRAGIKQAIKIELYLQSNFK